MMRSIFAPIALCAMLALTTVSVPAATIIDVWSSVDPPAPPALQSAQVDPGTTALLVLDFVKQICKGPRCTAALPVVAKVLQGARASHTTVIYSLGAGASPADILPPVAPLGGEPVVASGPDKFLGTELQQILTQKGIKTLVVTGMAAEGAVLYTASHAAFMGLKVVVPVDAMPSENLYAEQYVVWAFANAPRLPPNVTLTTSDRLTY